MLVKLSGTSGILQMFDVRGITTITVIIPFSHYGQGAVFASLQGKLASQPPAAVYYEFLHYTTPQHFYV